MDAASTLRTLRWKQICAGALSAASLIAGHLVFGQDTPAPRQRPSLSSAVPPAKADDGVAPILNARATPQPTRTPLSEARPAGNELPPILDSRKLPKPLPSQATFVPLEPRKEQPAVDARPVATLELAPQGAGQTVAKPSSVSPWMMDIDEALAGSTGKQAKSETASKNLPASKVESKHGLSQATTTPSPAKFAPPSSPGHTTKPAADRSNYPVAQLGTPQAAAPVGEKRSAPEQSSLVGRSPSDLRKPTPLQQKPAATSSAVAVPQMNPFIAPVRDSKELAAPTKSREASEAQTPFSTIVAANPRTSDSAIAPKLPETSPYGAYVLPTVDADTKNDLAARASRSPFRANAEAPSAKPSAETMEPSVAPLPPIVARGASTTTTAPRLDSPVAEGTPFAARNSDSPAAGFTLDAPRTSARGIDPPAAADRLQLAGYDREPRAFEEEPSLVDAAADEPAPGPQFPAQRQDPPQTQFQPEAKPQFTQVEAPRPLPGMPAGPFEMIGESGTVSVMVRRSMLLRTKTDIYRTAVVDPAICDVIQFTPGEISIIGKSQGSTHVTFWFDGPNTQPITYLVKVEPDSAEVKKEEDKYKLLEDVVNEMFPDSKVQLMLVADKLIVKGQAKDSEEATQIMAIIRTNAGSGVGGAWGPGGWNGGAGGGLSEGAAADVLSDSATGSAARARYQVINMLRVPGVQQVALRVKIAELNRTAARGFGVDVQGNVAFSDSPEGTDLFFNSILNIAGGGAPALLAQFDGDDISIGIRYLQQQGVIRLLSEPTLVTMSGRPATFIAGGEFAVPTVVGSAGLNAVTTDFRAFGAIISFLPTVVDKDRIRLEVSPEFSQINQSLAVGGTPGLKTRAVTTTVEMREGQTFAIAGLLEDNMNGSTVGDLPFLAQIFGRRSMQRAETELIILVTPELVHAMEAEEVPPLPGFDVTEPDNAQFFLHGKIEGTPTREYRSTVWPRLKNRYKAGGPAMTSGPFGHGQ